MVPVLHWIPARLPLSVDIIRLWNMFEYPVPSRTFPYRPANGLKILTSTNAFWTVIKISKSCFLQRCPGLPYSIVGCRFFQLLHQLFATILLWGAAQLNHESCCDERLQSRPFLQDFSSNQNMHHVFTFSGNRASWQPYLIRIRYKKVFLSNWNPLSFIGSVVSQYAKISLFLNRLSAGIFIDFGLVIRGQSVTQVSIGIA